jgi:hypothetical protein
MSLNLINAVLNLYDVNKTGVGRFEIVWLILGVSSIIVLFLYAFKKSTSEKIQVDSIEKIKERSFFGRRKFSIQLKDGKNRDLIGIKNQSEFDELKKMFTKIGIAN